MTGNDYEQAMGQQQRDAEPTGAIKVGRKLKVGDAVQHEEFGKGIVTRFGEYVVWVAFEGYHCVHGVPVNDLTALSSDTPTPEPDALAAANERYEAALQTILNIVHESGCNDVSDMLDTFKQRGDALAVANARIEALEAERDALVMSNEAWMKKAQSLETVVNALQRTIDLLEDEADL